MKLAAGGMLLLLTAAAHAQAPADQACRIIPTEIRNYQVTTGNPCACPYSVMRNGAQCGDRSAWAKPNSKAPHCYAGDLDGTIPSNQTLKGTRQSWPEPPPCQGVQQPG